MIDLLGPSFAKGLKHLKKERQPIYSIPALFTFSVAIAISTRLVFALWFNALRVHGLQLKKKPLCRNNFNFYLKTRGMSATVGWGGGNFRCLEGLGAVA